MKQLGFLGPVREPSAQYGHFCARDDPKAEEAALIHVQLDALCSSNSIFKKQLETLANIDARKRNKTRRRRTRAYPSKKTMQADPMKDFSEFLKKLTEIRRLSKRLLG